VIRETLSQLFNSGSNRAIFPVCLRITFFIRVHLWLLRFFSTLNYCFNRAGHLAQLQRRAYAVLMAQPDCPLCGGTGWKTVERVAEEEKVTRGSWLKPIEGTDTGKRVWAVPCGCTGKDRSSRAMGRARIPTRYEHCDFDNFDTKLYDSENGPEFPKWNHGLEQAKVVTEAFARDYPAGPDTGLLLMGPCGAASPRSGKSFCAGTRDFFTTTANCSRKFREVTIRRARRANSACSNPYSLPTFCCSTTSAPANLLRGRLKPSGTS